MREKMRKKIRKAAFMTEKAKKTMHSRIFLKHNYSTMGFPTIFTQIFIINPLNFDKITTFF